MYSSCRTDHPDQVRVVVGCQAARTNGGPRRERSGEYCTVRGIRARRCARETGARDGIGWGWKVLILVGIAVMGIGVYWAYNL